MQSLLTEKIFVSLRPKSASLVNLAILLMLVNFFGTFLQEQFETI